MYNVSKLLYVVLLPRVNLAIQKCGKIQIENRNCFSKRGRWTRIAAFDNVRDVSDKVFGYEKNRLRMD